MKLIAFDPSVQATGVAYLVGGEVAEAWTIKPKSPGQARYAEIGKEVLCDLRALSGPANVGLPDYTVMEFPDKWTRAGKNVEDIQKLCTVVGVILGVCTLFGLPVRLYKPSQWKGQKTKAVTQAELQLQGYDLKKLRWDDNACDAAALGLWAEGRLRVERGTS